MSTNSPNDPFSREGAESLAHTVRQAQRAMEEPPLSAVHINQGSADAMADAYDAEYQASRTMTTPPNAPQVDVLTVLRESTHLAAYERKRINPFGHLEWQESADKALSKVSELLAREAALVAERDALAAEVGELRGLLSDTAANLDRMAGDEFSDCDLVRLNYAVERINDNLARTYAARVEAGMGDRPSADLSAFP